MQYLGGKTRLASDIAALIKSLRGGRDKYVEPFLGGGSVLAKVAPMFRESAAGDVQSELMHMWQAAAAGWVPPSDVSEDDYRAAKSMEPGKLRAFIGFGCSFGAKWFGGYARASDGKNYAAIASRSVAKKAAVMRRTALRACPYWEWDAEIDDKTVVYCDPPYEGTEPYSATARFDHDLFWRSMERWSARGSLVLVSEYAAPEGWSAAFSRKHYRKMARQDGQTHRQMEKVFIFGGSHGR